MVTYEDLTILPHQHPTDYEFCGMCGTNLKWVEYTEDGNEYHYCPKCKTIKFWVE